MELSDNPVLDALFKRAFREKHAALAITFLTQQLDYITPRDCCKAAFAGTQYAENDEVIDKLCDFVSAHLGQLFRTGLKINDKKYVVLRTRAFGRKSNYGYKTELVEAGDERKLEFHFGLIDTMNTEECLRVLDLVRRRLIALNAATKEAR